MDVRLLNLICSRLFQPIVFLMLSHGGSSFPTVALAFPRCYGEWQGGFLERKYTTRELFRHISPAQGQPGQVAVGLAGSGTISPAGVPED